ncbi:hypothetical protein LTR62_008783 [Meristemomyces frigidus]|uniref:Uncharacterized protein n=1 Tax=Meristemomyces frigidus TaxID=1508187 RepID=A0AAN7TAD0_9PEZI|nr:hypothetical protein LTR62_008783 [Meristemomyces frigidus]
MAEPPTQPVPFTVHGKTAIITGAGSGINYCFAKLLLSRNCNVLIADLGLRPEAQKLVDDYASKEDGKPRCAFVKTDVVQWPELERMFVVAEKEFGGVDIVSFVHLLLVCPGAGIFEPHWTNFWHPPGSAASKDSPHPADGRGHYALLDINITHPIRCTQLAISRWLNPPPDSKTGKVAPSNPKRVVHISSIAGQAPSFSAPLYIASKHAISGFIRSMGELDRLGIRVNGVAPGVIRTPLWLEHPEKMQMIADSDIWVEPEEVAVAMLRCCEDEEVVGGYVMEVSKGKTRWVGWRDDPGPRGEGNSASNSQNTIDEVFGWLEQPGWGVVGE